MGNIGFKVSKKGFDVKKASPSNLIIDSARNSIKIKKIIEGSILKTITGAESFSIAHGLDYTPGYRFFIKSKSRWGGETGSEDAFDHQWWCEIDNNNFTIINITGPIEGLKYKLYLFADPATGEAASTSGAENYGIKVSQEGFDVKKATDQQLLLNSAAQTFKIIKVETIYSAGGEIVVPHGLDYTPAWFALVNSDGDFSGINTVIVPYLLVGTREVFVWADSKNIGVRIESIAVFNYTIKIAILANKLE